MLNANRYEKYQILGLLGLKTVTGFFHAELYEARILKPS